MKSCSTAARALRFSTILETEFDPLEHSVYLGRELLGRYARISKKLYAAFDAQERSLGEFKKRSDAYASIAHRADKSNTQSAKWTRR